MEESIFVVFIQKISVFRDIFYIVIIYEKTYKHPLYAKVFFTQKYK